MGVIQILLSIKDIPKFGQMNNININTFETTSFQGFLTNSNQQNLF